MNMKSTVHSSASRNLVVERIMGAAATVALLLHGSSAASANTVQSHGPSRGPNASSPAQLPAAALVSDKLAGDIHPSPNAPDVPSYIVRLRQPAVPEEISALRRAGARVTRRY